MLPRSYPDQHCSIAATLELIGDRWTLLLIREAFLGTRRFDELQRNLGLSRTVLTERLGRLVENGLLERVCYQHHPERHEYRLTERGRDLWPALVALCFFGDRHLMAGKPPVIWRHRDCGGELSDRRVCERCGAELDSGDVEPWAGPGALPHTKAWLEQRRNSPDGSPNEPARAPLPPPPFRREPVEESR